MILFTLLTDEERERINRLIPRVAYGDESALNGIYEAVGGRLLSVAMGVTRNITLAEDAVSESFLKVVRFAAKFKGGNGYGWLCTIVKNTALNLLKRENLKSGEDIDGFFGLSDGKSFSANSETAIMVERAMMRLSKEERLYIWLKYFNDLTVREIAGKAGVSKSTVQDVIKRAEGKLREYM